MASTQKPKARRGRGEGSITQLPDGRWKKYVSLGKKADGSRDRRAVYGKTKNECLERARELESARDKGTLADAGGMTVAAWLDRWLEIHKPAIGSTTWDTYEQHVRLHLKPHLADVPLAKFRPAHANELPAKWNAAGVSPPLQAKVITTLRSACKEAVRLGMIAVNPALLLKKPRTQKVAAVQAWTPEEAKAFLKAAEGRRLYALFAVALDAGLRQGELYGLHWPEVDFDAGTVRVVQSLRCRRGKLSLKAPTTAASRRLLRLAPGTVAALNDHRRRMLAEGRDVRTGPVFCDTVGNYLRRGNVCRREFDPLQKAAGVKEIRFHDLRHTCATHLLLDAINVKAVSARLGHSSVKITLDTYAHVLPEMDEQIVRSTSRRLYG